MTVYKVAEVEELVQTVKHLLVSTEIHCFIHAMAVSDFKTGKIIPLQSALEEPSQLEGDRSDHAPAKISSGEPLVMTLLPTPKVIGMVKDLSPETILVGFKLLSGVSEETLIDTARKMAEANKCDFVLANDLANIDGQMHIGYLLDRDKTVAVYETKEAIAEGLIDTVLKGVAE